MNTFTSDLVKFYRLSKNKVIVTYDIFVTLDALPADVQEKVEIIVGFKDGKAFLEKSVVFLIELPQPLV